MTAAFLLPRIGASPMPALLRLSVDVAERSKELLGYTLMWSGHQRYVDEMKLLEACAATGVRPFETKAVQDYMSLVVAQKFPHSIARWFACVFVVVLVGAFLARGTAWSTVFLAPALPLLIAFVVRNIYEDHLQFEASRWGWAVTDLPVYSSPVPSGVLAMALSLRAQLPDARFEVSQLTREVLVDDPFLSVHLGDAMFYIAQWDEPKFGAEYA